MAKKPIKLTNGDDTESYGKGDQIVNARGGDDVVSGGAGNDKLNGGAGNDILRGGAGDDTLTGGAGDDTLLGGSGDDTLVGGLGTNTVDGGTGDDIVKIAGNFADATVVVDGDYYVITVDGVTTKVKNVELFQFDDGTVDQEAIDDAANPGGINVTLTTGLDNAAGEADDDTINGLVSSVAGTSTLTVGDIIDGKDGSDTLRIAVDGAATTVDTGVATVTNVEALTIVNGSSALATIDGDSDGYTSVSVDKTTGATTIQGVGTAAAISIGAAAGAMHTVTFDAVTGTADAASVTVGTAATGAALTLAGIETVNLTLTGKALLDGANSFAAATAINIKNADTSTVNLSGATGTKAAVTVTGAGVLTLGTLNASIATVDASASTGGITATLNAAQTSVKGGAGVDTITVVAPTTTLSLDTGAGNDVVNISAIDAAAGGIDGTNEIIGGGDGTDTLVTDETDLTAANIVANVNKTTGFEVLRATGDITALNASKFTGINTFELAAAVTAAAISVANDDTLVLAANSTALTLSPVLNSGADVLNLTLSASTANLTHTSITASSHETINIVSNDTDATAANTNTITSLVVQNNTKINISGAADLTLTTGTGTTLTIDGSTATGVLNITASAGNDTVSGGAKADTLSGLAGIDTISGGAGADIIIGGDDNDILTGGADADTFRFAAGDLAAAPSSTNFDTITDFAKGADIIDFGSAITIVTNAVSGIGVAAINAEGIATFNAADDTLDEMIVAVEAGINAGGAAAAGQTAIFEVGGDSYVFISDGTDGIGANDVLIKLDDVTGLTNSTINATNDLLIA